MWELEIEPDDYIRIVSPQPDDGKIGCGGLILTCGVQTEMLLVTDGRTAHGADLTDEQCTAKKYLEFKQMLEKTCVKRHFS